MSLNIPAAAFGAPAPPAPWRFAPVDPRTAQRLNAAQPVAPGLLPARPFVLTGDAGDRARALTCLTQAVYYEAASESEEGQRAVAQVVLNRVRHPLFPHSICGVVYQGALGAGCQFSFVCDGSMDRPRAAWAWTAAEAVARGALNGQVQGAVGQATHYHADYVAPYWAPTVVKVAQIGAHIFYRWSGDLGLPQAFSARYVAVEVVPVVKPHAVADPQLVIASAPAAASADDGLRPTPEAAAPGALSALQRVHLALDADGYAIGRGAATRRAAPTAPASDADKRPAAAADPAGDAPAAAAPSAATAEGPPSTGVPAV